MTAHGPQIATYQDPATGSVNMTYCPGRDFINIYPLMLHQVAQHFDNGRWNETIRQFAESEILEFEDAYNLVADAVAAQAQFVTISCENPQQTYADVLEACGWNAVHPKARQIYLMAMGELVQGQVFAGVRDVAYAGERPPKHWQLCLQHYWNISIAHMDTEDYLYDTILHNYRNKQVSAWDLVRMVFKVLLFK